MYIGSIIEVVPVKINFMKKILIVCIAGFILACNNEGTKENTITDSTIIEKDNTINTDTMPVPPDTMKVRHDSLHK